VKLLNGYFFLKIILFEIFVTAFLNDKSKRQNQQFKLFFMETVIAFIAFFATVFGIMYVFYTTRNKERLALIEKGADATLFNTGKELKFSWNKVTLKIGMLAVGIALGILVGASMSDAGMLNEDVNYSSMIFMFGGLSLILFYVIDRKRV
jgi:ABC-type cobalamin transport system permease subunit